MQTVQKSIRIPINIFKEIESLSAQTGRDFSTTTKHLLEEAVKMRRVPGIVFTEGIKGRRAKVAGTGSEVWEIIAAYKGLEMNFNRLKKAYHWLTDQQLKSAISYYDVFTEEIESLIQQNESWTKETVFQQYPFLARSDT